MNATIAHLHSDKTTVRFQVEIDDYATAKAAVIEAFVEAHGVAPKDVITWDNKRAVFIEARGDYASRGMFRLTYLPFG